MEDKLTLLEKLSNEVEDHKDTIAKLNDVIKSMKDHESNKWQQHTICEITELTKDLPIPRIQMTYSTDGYNNKWVYGFVLKPYWFQWEPENKLLFIPISQTTGHGQIFPVDSVEHALPFRDGVHIKHDSKIFNLPAYFVHEEIDYCEKINFDDK